jgi:hypothetical protein
MDDGESERELLEYLYFVKCDEVGVDETGRFVLPPAAREKAGPRWRGLFQGKGRKFHILKPDDGAAADDRVLKCWRSSVRAKNSSIPSRWPTSAGRIPQMSMHNDGAGRRARPICRSFWGRS